jgi:site-specific recombinase XerC
MTETAISPLRRRMIEDMTVRNFVEKTRNDYIRHVKNLTAFLGRSPDKATAEDLRLYRLHLTEAGAHPPTINSAVSALRFFFSVTVDRPAVTKPLTFVAEPRKIPVVLSPEEVARFLEAAPGPKYKAALSAGYGAGLRVSEVVALKVSDVDSRRMLLRIEQGKGRRDRFAMLSPQLLELLRDWWRIARPQVCPGLAVPRTEPAQPSHHASVQSGGPCRRPQGRDRQAGHAAHAAPQLRNSPAGAEHRHSRDPSPARARQARDHGALYAGRYQHHPHGHEPAQSAHADTDEARRAAGLARQRSCPVPLWRSRTSSATTGPLGARPTPAM